MLVWSVSFWTGTLRVPNPILLMAIEPANYRAALRALLSAQANQTASRVVAVDLGIKPGQTAVFMPLLIIKVFLNDGESRAFALPAVWSTGGSPGKTFRAM